jgi:alkylation response protein AidB-like acyl-CoA dehydrogenase
VDEWEKAEEIPAAVYARASEVGLLASIIGWPEDMGLPPRPEGFDQFFMVIATDELCRCASGGVVWGLIGGFGIGMPPLVHYGSDELKQRVAIPCIQGKKRIALAVSEPTAGSDVAGIKTFAEDKGDHWIVNGDKKWITCGTYADYFTVACQTKKDSGMAGIELLLVERSMQGVSTRAMDCMGVKGSGTAFVEFDNVKVCCALASEGCTVSVRRARPPQRQSLLVAQGRRS